MGHDPARAPAAASRARNPKPTSPSGHNHGPKPKSTRNGIANAAQVRATRAVVGRRISPPNSPAESRPRPRMISGKAAEPSRYAPYPSYTTGPFSATANAAG